MRTTNCSKHHSSVGAFPGVCREGAGKEYGCADESLDIFRFRQDAANKYGLRTTLQITYGSLFSDVMNGTGARAACSCRVFGKERMIMELGYGFAERYPLPMSGQSVLVRLRWTDASGNGKIQIATKSSVANC